MTSGSSKGQSLGLTRSCLLAYAASCPRGLLRCRRLPASLPVLFSLPSQDPKWIVTVPASNSRRRRIGMMFRRILSERADWFTPNHAPSSFILAPPMASLMCVSTSIAIIPIFCRVDETLPVPNLFPHRTSRVAINTQPSTYNYSKSKKTLQRENEK